MGTRGDRPPVLAACRDGGLLAVLLLTGGACGDASGDRDASTDTIASDDAPPLVDVFVEVDAGDPDAGGRVPRGLLCATTMSVPVTGCEVQDPAVATACEEGGRVVFDGERCVLPAGTGCAGDVAAFASFEDCAVSCAAAGACNVRWERFCDEMWVCLQDEYEVPEGLCSLAARSMLNCGPFGDDQRYACGRNPTCASFAMDTPELRMQMCAISLLPTVSRIRCWVWI